MRFAEPHASVFKEPVIPGPRRLGPPDSPAKQARLHAHPHVAARLAPVAPTSMPHVPFARAQTFEALAVQQHAQMRASVGPMHKMLGKPGESTGPVASFADSLNLNLVGVVDAVEDSTLVRYGSYAVATGGAMVIVPVATVFLLSFAGLYAGLWGVKQITHLGASQARRVLGLAEADYPRPPSPERDADLVWPTDPYLPGHDDF